MQQHCDEYITRMCHDNNLLNFCTELKFRMQITISCNLVKYRLNKLDEVYATNAFINVSWWQWRWLL